MTGPRKRTLGSVLLLAAALTLGTANSSQAVRRKVEPAKKSHSTTVKKNQTNRCSSQALSSAREKSGSHRDSAQHHGAGRSKSAERNLAERKAEKSTTGLTVPVANKETARAAETPRAAQPERQIRRTVSASIQRTRTRLAAAEDAALRSALARRASWNDEGRRTLEPAKVQDPPADSIGETVPERILVRHEERRELALNETPNEDLIREALRKRGTPYVWGGASRGGWDCSGFVCYIFRAMRGMNLPHSASAQSRLGTPVRKDDLQPGDLVFFSTYRPGVSHVGIYIGNNQFIHAANTRRDTRIDSISGYYGKRYKWARRLTPTPIQFSPQQLDQLTTESSEMPQAER